MANIAKGYGVGDTVFVAYPHPDALYFTPQSRVVESADINSATNESTVNFVTGKSVQDGADQTVFTTQPLAAKKIVDDVIAKVDATVNLDTTASDASTVGQIALSLARSSV